MEEKGGKGKQLDTMEYEWKETQDKENETKNEQKLGGLR